MFPTPLLLQLDAFYLVTSIMRRMVDESVKWRGLKLLG
jgi:hypothetical protein